MSKHFVSVSMLVSCSDVQPLDSLGCQNENMSTWAWGQVLGEPMGRTWGSIVGFQFGVPVWGSSFGAAKRPPGRVGLFRVSLLESQTGPAFRAKKAPFPESSPSTRSQHFVDMWRGFVLKCPLTRSPCWLTLTRRR